MKRLLLAIEEALAGILGLIVVVGGPLLLLCAGLSLFGVITLPPILAAVWIGVWTVSFITILTMHKIYRW